MLKLKIIIVVILMAVYLNPLKAQTVDNSDKSPYSQTGFTAAFKIAFAPFQDKPSFAQNYDLSLGYNFNNFHTILISFNLYQLWENEYTTSNSKRYAGSYFEDNFALLYKLKLSAFSNTNWPLKRISLIAGPGMINNGHHTITFIFSPEYSIEFSRIFSFPIGIKYIHAFSHPAESYIDSYDYFGLYAGIQFN